MANEIICEKNFIKDIFKRWYRIPEYQRPYVWENEQVETLLEDTIDAFRLNADSQYFLGSAVLKINEKTSDNLTYEEYDLLDGQQRLTTIFLILAVIRDITSNDNIRELCRTAVFQKEKRKADMTLLKEFEENIYSGKVYDRTTKQYRTRAPLLKKRRGNFQVH